MCFIADCSSTIDGNQITTQPQRTMCINSLLRLIGDVLLENHKIPNNLYECKSLLKGLKMPYVKINVYVNNCMIYYKQDELKKKCDLCGESRYVVLEQAIQGRKLKPIPRKVLRYLPVIPRLIVYGAMDKLDANQILAICSDQRAANF
jgi:hypothetical protein